MDPVSLTQPAMPQRPATYAGFWKRFVAYIIDWCIISFVSLFFLIPLAIIIGVGGANADLDDPSVGLLAIITGMSLMIVSVLVILHWLYYAVMESTRGATFGKMALGLRVTDMNGGAVSFGRASGRYFAKIISSLTFCIGYIIAGFSQQKQALHDMIAGCLVINKE